MRKLKAFNMVEIMIVICLLATTVILCLPVIFNNTKEARIVSGWKKSFAEMKSNFEVFNITDAEVIDGICKSNIADKEIEIFKVISPYLNVDTTKDTHSLKHYHYKFKNGKPTHYATNLTLPAGSTIENGPLRAASYAEFSAGDIQKFYQRFEINEGGAKSYLEKFTYDPIKRKYAYEKPVSSELDSGFDEFLNELIYTFFD